MQSTASIQSSSSSRTKRYRPLSSKSTSGLRSVGSCLESSNMMMRRMIMDENDVDDNNDDDEGNCNDDMC